MFYKAKVKALHGHLVDLEPLLKDRNGKYNIVRKIPILHLGGGDTTFNHRYKVGDTVVVALCGYPVKYDSVNHDLRDMGNFDSSVVIGRLYESESDDGVTIKYKEGSIGITKNEKLQMKGKGKEGNLYLWLDKLLDQLMKNKTSTQLGPMTINPSSILLMQEIKDQLKTFMEE